jgi:hypothetical protein
MIMYRVNDNFRKQNSIHKLLHRLCCMRNKNNKLLRNNLYIKSHINYI